MYTPWVTQQCPWLAHTSSVQCRVVGPRFDNLWGRSPCGCLMFLTHPVARCDGNTAIVTAFLRGDMPAT